MGKDDIYDAWKDIVPINPWYPINKRKPPGDIREEILRRLREARRTCPTCDGQFRSTDEKTGNLYKFCPYCGSILSQDATLEQIKILLEEINSKLGGYLESVKSKRSKSKGG